MRREKTFELESALDLSEDQNSITPFDTDQTDNIFVIIDCTSVTENDGSFTAYFRHKLSETSFSSYVQLTLSESTTLADADAVKSMYFRQLPPGQIQIRFDAPGSGTPDGSARITVSRNCVGG